MMNKHKKFLDQHCSKLLHSSYNMLNKKFLHNIYFWNKLFSKLFDTRN